MNARTLPQALLSAVSALVFTASSLLVSPALVSPAQAQQPAERLAGGIRNATRAALPGSQPERVRSAEDLGAVDGSTPLASMTLVFSRSAQQQADLEALIAAQQDTSSAQYHQWLTPQQFGARFGMADADLAKAQAWLQSQGFTVDSVAPSRNSISFSGSAAAVASAFGAPLHRYSVGGETHMAPSADITLPSALAGVVAGVRNLSDFRPRPRVRHASAVRPSFTSSQTGNHFLTPGDIATIYDIKAAYNSGYNGAGQTIAIMGQSAVVPADITAFQTAIGQTAKAPVLLLLPSTGTSTRYSGDESESDLDLEYATGIAPGATVYFVYVGANATASVFDSLTYAIQNRVASILNISYGECEPLLGQSQYNSINALLAQAAAQGQTVISAAGDEGSTDCYGASGTSTAQMQQLSVDFPSSSQYVTAVGGTEFPSGNVTASTSTTTYWTGGSSDVISSAISYIPEQVWNDDTASDPQSPLSAGGGGASVFTARPSWQTGVPGIPSGSMRLLPDIALDSSPNNASYAYCSSDTSAWASGQGSSCTLGLRDSVSQDLTVAGGTSFAAPIFAGMVAILGQARGYSSQGVVNPTLYSLASNSSTYASAFHDITAGGNFCNIGVTYCVASTSGSFAAGVGYDEATGLGSVDFNNLLAAWPANSGGTSASPSFTLSATPVSVTQTATSSSVTSTSTITVTPKNGYTGTIAWTVLPSATIPSACYSLPNTTVSGSSPVNATLTVTTAIATCPAGTTFLARPGSTNIASLSRPGTPSLDARSPQPSQASLQPENGRSRLSSVASSRGSGRSPAAPVTLAALALGTLGWFGSRRRSRRLPTLLAVLLLAGAGLGLSGCGGGSTTAGTGGTGTGTGTGGSSSSSTTYTITVIGTDTANNSITASTTLAFTITQQ